MPEGDSVFKAARRLRELNGRMRSDFRVPSLATDDLSGALSGAPGYSRGR